MQIILFNFKIILKNTLTFIEYTVILKISKTLKTPKIMIFFYYFFVSKI